MMPRVVLLFLLATISGCAHLASSKDTRIEEASFVSIGGIEQWITVRGENRSNPVLLIVHGGPADPQSVLPDTYAPYEKDFVVVQWDQRGAGRTFIRNREIVKELSLERMAQDGLEVTDYLRSHLGKRKVIVLGHSWGTILATEMVKQKPELFSAYVGTGQASSWQASVREQWAALTSGAQSAKDQTTLDLMQKIGEPDPINVGQYFSWRNILNRKYLGSADSQWLTKLRSLTASSLGLTEVEFKAFGEGGNFSALSLIKVMITTDLGVSARVMPVPFFVIQGRDDLYTPTNPAIDYFKQVQAPKKDLVVIEGAGHFAMMTHSTEFVDALVSKVKPIAGRAN